MNINKYIDYYTCREIYDMAYYLILLFYKTNCKYMCHRPKINRLLTIYMLCNINKKSNLKDSRFFLDDKYMGFDLSMINRDVYLTFNRETNTEITEMFNEDIEIPDYYKYYIDRIDLMDSEKKLLECIFRKFGNFYNIGAEVQQLKDIIKVDNDINIKDFLNSLHDKQTIEKYKNNSVFNFIKEYHDRINKQIKTDKELENVNIDIYNKLVRDRIPQIIKNEGDYPIIRNIYDNNNYRNELLNTLFNDYNELDKLDGNSYIEKLSDMVELIRQLAKLNNTSLDYLITLADNNISKYGSFEDRVYLERVLRKEK